MTTQLHQRIKQFPQTTSFVLFHWQNHFRRDVRFGFWFFTDENFFDFLGCFEDEMSIELF
jgi:hypothetical protein